MDKMGLHPALLAEEKNVNSSNSHYYRVLKKYCQVIHRKVNPHNK